MLTNTSHHYKSESNDIKIKTEIFEAEDVENQFETNEKCEGGTDNKEKILKLNKNSNEPNCDVKIKSEICEINYFEPPTDQIEEISNDNEIHKVFIKVEDKIDYCVKHEINEEFIIKEDEKQEDFSGLHNVVQQEPLSNQNEPANSDGNKNVSTFTQNKEHPQKIKKIKCKKNPATYSNKKDRNLKTKKKSYICDVCQKVFRQMSQLKVHKLIHTGDKQFVCDICQKKFNRKYNLECHKLTHSDEKPLACDVCQKTFSRKSHLNTHKLMHTGEKPFVCDVCQKEYSRIDTLENHKLTHVVDKPHACDVCQKTFVTKYYLKMHKLVHTGGKPYSCGVCQKEFIKKFDLKRHLFIHSGEKPHSCDVCQRTFIQIGSLKRHKLVHTNEKP